MSEKTPPMTDAPAITREERKNFLSWCDIRLTSGNVSHEYYRKAVHFYEAVLTAAEKEIMNLRRERDGLREALDERGLFSNPDFMDEIANEIDCCPGCENVWWESDTNASGCGLSEKGGYCPNDLAETLRAVAKVARAALSKKDNQNG